ncbi:hypothetical protein [Undibacterium terreum]|uniref:Uncharacterized protein n=1 Tax=Undibacterium terreum TaxID=1224302 RepID=A0A916V298_9BURK|nr:hypothetical protein [Undibacterium terreum]GGD00468.1 hypothetical protein GCM10011396_55040 [Undibacterium terreum]
MREGQAKVLSERELSHVVNMVKKKAHAKRNVALLYCSFGLGLPRIVKAEANLHLVAKSVIGHVLTAHSVPETEKKRDDLAVS